MPAEPLTAGWSDAHDPDLADLAAAHPVAYTALIDSCVRSQHWLAVDTLVAAEVYMHAAAALLPGRAEAGWAALMGDPAAVAGLASALASLVKRTALSISRVCHRA
jgi:hypothetical protein